MVRLRLKGRDAWWTCFAIDPLAGPLVRWSAPRAWVTPNRLTVASALVAVAAAAAFAADLLVVGAIVYQLSFLLDCMDGKLAKLRGQSNPWGGFYDVAADTIRFVACYVALATVVLPSQPEAWELALVALYPCARFAVFMLGTARPAAPAREANLEVDASFGAILRAAPSRLTAPGTTVDNETIAFTIGPLLGVPLAGIAVAAVVDALHALQMIAGALPKTAEGPGPSPEVGTPPQNR